MIELIKSVPKVDLQREANIAKRTIDAVHNGAEGVSDDALKRMAEAAERVRGRLEREKLEELTTLEWLRQQHAQIGLAALARKLEEDRSNLAKVIAGKRRPSATLQAMIEKICFRKR